MHLQSVMTPTACSYSSQSCHTNSDSVRRQSQLCNSIRVQNFTPQQGVNQNFTPQQGLPRMSYLEACLLGKPEQDFRRAGNAGFRAESEWNNSMTLMLHSLEQRNRNSQVLDQNPCHARKRSGLFLAASEHLAKRHCSSTAVHEEISFNLLRGRIPSATSWLPGMSFPNAFDLYPKLVNSTYSLPQNSRTATFCPLYQPSSSAPWSREGSSAAWPDSSFPLSSARLSMEWSTTCRCGMSAGPCPCGSTGPTPVAFDCCPSSCQRPARPAPDDLCPDARSAFFAGDAAGGGGAFGRRPAGRPTAGGAAYGASAPDKGLSRLPAQVWPARVAAP